MPSPKGLVLLSVCLPVKLEEGKVAAHKHSPKASGPLMAGSIISQTWNRKKDFCAMKKGSDTSIDDRQPA